MADDAVKNFCFCIHCGCQNQAKNLFCSKCGQRIHVKQPPGSNASDMKTCEKCGHPNHKSSRFCAACSISLVKDFRVVETGDYDLVEIHLDQIDYENHRDLNTLSKRLKNNKILFDMANVQWIDSTGIGALVTLCHRLTRSNQDIKFFNVTPKVQEAFRALQVDNVLSICKEKSDALVSWGLPPF